MKRIFILTFFLIVSTHYSWSQYPSWNINLLSTWDSVGIPSEPVYGIRYAGIWGWHDGNGKEYAIIGSTEGYHVVEVTNPALPVQRAFIPGCVNQTIWREIKTYQNYVYCVSDDGGNNCLVIADLSYLPDSVHIVHRSDSIISRSHTIFVDGNKLYGGYVHGGSISGNSASMAVYSLANPEQPLKLREFNQDVPNIGVVHDMLVVNDTVFASCGFDGLYIAKFDTVTNQFNLINSVTAYPFSGYNHSSAITADHNTLIIADEVPTNLPLKAFDISDLQNISFPSSFTSMPNTIATPHNPFMIGEYYLVVAYYQDGIQIFDISIPSNPVRVGYIDTNPNDGAGLPNPSYSGCWGAYVDLPSGVVLASDMQNGLFVLNISSAMTLNEFLKDKFQLSVYPNPVNDFAELKITTPYNESLTLSVNDVNGREVMHKNFSLTKGINKLQIDLQTIANGIYTLYCNTNKYSLAVKVVKMEPSR